MASEAALAYPHATWRLIIDGEADGATNMAIDEAILNGVIEGTSLPTLRFYAWSPPCLSLGRSQKLAEVDQAVCRVDGVDVVRRATGGRAILHTDELTYSVSLSLADPRSEGSVIDVYRRLSKGLLAGLARLGVVATQARGRRVAGDEQTAVCFEMPSEYEITVVGRKLVGSAQWRTRGGLLQHGTVPLCGDLTRIVSYLALSDDERRGQSHRLRSKALTMEEATGIAPSFDTVARALAEGFSETLNLALVLGELGPGEQVQSAEIRERVYATPDWTAHL